MEFKQLVSISGKGGLFQAQTQRADGMIVTSLEDGKTGFVPSRKHMFTPLESITIYTEDDSEDLITVFRTMRQKKDALKIPQASSATAEELRDFFRTVLPDFDEEKVYVSDIKKIIKWHRIIEDKNVSLEEEGEEVKEGDGAADTVKDEKKDKQKPSELAEEDPKSPKASKEKEE